jgi:uncharacterized protein with HEPN domain
MSKRDDLMRLQDMRDAAQTAVDAVRGRSRADLSVDHVWMLGLVKCVEIIGEAAARVGRETRDRLSGLPWPDMIGMRNRLVHGYFEIDEEQVWSAVTVDLPRLVGLLGEAIQLEKSRRGG